MAFQHRLKSREDIDWKDLYVLQSKGLRNLQRKWVQPPTQGCLTSSAEPRCHHQERISYKGYLLPLYHGQNRDGQMSIHGLTCAAQAKRLVADH